MKSIYSIACPIALNYKLRYAAGSDGVRRTHVRHGAGEQRLAVAALGASADALQRHQGRDRGGDEGASRDALRRSVRHLRARGNLLSSRGHHHGGAQHPHVLTRESLLIISYLNVILVEIMLVVLNF